MRYLALAVLIAAASAAAATPDHPMPAKMAPAKSKSAALKPATKAFLKELGIDPKSKDVLMIAADSVTSESGKVYTLDSLAARRNEDGVKAFIATRVFVRAFYKDSSAKFPDSELYIIYYLTADEKSYIGKHMCEHNKC